MKLLCNKASSFQPPHYIVNDVTGTSTKLKLITLKFTSCLPSNNIIVQIPTRKLMGVTTTFI